MKATKATKDTKAMKVYSVNNETFNVIGVAGTNYIERIPFSLAFSTGSMNADFTDENGIEYVCQNDAIIRMADIFTLIASPQDKAIAEKHRSVLNPDDKTMYAINLLLLYEKGLRKLNHTFTADSQTIFAYRQASVHHAKAMLKGVSSHHFVDNIPLLSWLFEILPLHNLLLL